MTGNRLTVGPTSGRGWQVSGRDQTFRTQALAIQAAKQDLLSRGGGELLVKGRGGRVREQRTIRRHRRETVESADLLSPRRGSPETHPAVLGQESAPIDDAFSVRRQGRRLSGHRRVLRLSFLLAVVVVVLVAVATSRDGQLVTEEPSAVHPTATLSGSPSTDAIPDVVGSLSYRGTGSAEEPPVRLAAGRYRATATVSATGAACRFSVTIESVEAPPVTEELRVDATSPGARITQSEELTLRAAPYFVRVSAPGCRWTVTIEPLTTTP